jgi:hypothetical protein
MFSPFSKNREVASCLKSWNRRPTILARLQALSKACEIESGRRRKTSPLRLPGGPCKAFTPEYRLSGLPACVRAVVSLTACVKAAKNFHSFRR